MSLSSVPVSAACHESTSKEESCEQVGNVEFGDGERPGSDPGRPDYWERYLAGAPPLALPTDRPRPAVLRPGEDVEICSFSEELSDGLRRLSRETGFELATTGLAVFSLLLHRYTAQDKFVIATWRGTGPLLPVVADFSDRPSFSQLLRRLEVEIRTDLDAGAVPTDLLERLAIEPDPSRHPIFQVAFFIGVDGPPAPPPSISSGTPATGLDLCLELSGNSQVSARLHYNRDLFERPTATRMLNHIQQLLAGAIEDIDRSATELPMLTDRELYQQLVEWNNTAREYPQKCLHELVEAMATKRPNDIAVTYGQEQLSYRALNIRANQVAHYLRKRGVSHNVRVGICLERSLEFAVAILGVLKAGGACVPLDPKYPGERLTFMFCDVAAPMILTERGLLQASIPNGTKVLYLSQESETFLQEPATNPCTSSVVTDIAYVIYTSGSTGRPRGVLLPHAGLVNYTLAAAELFDLRPGDRMLQFCSISFDAAVEEIFATWAAGATLVFRPEDVSLEPSELLGWAAKQHITAIDLPTAYWHEWVYAMPGLSLKVPPGLRLVVVGGERASAEAYSTWHKFVGNRVRWINTYGPAEASICATTHEPKLRLGEDPPAVLPIGRPVANTRVYLLDPHLNPVPVGVPGELHIGGVGVAQGYLNLPELTEKKFIPDTFSDVSARLYKTGDLARYLPSGDIEFLGRRDDQVKIRGYRVEPGEIESVLGKHPGVREVAVIVHEDLPGNKRLVGYVVRSQQTATERELQQHVQKRLPEYMVPSGFVFLESMPPTPNGKTNRQALSMMKFDSSLGGTHTAVAVDPLQAQLIKTWEELLGRKPIGLRDDFFELGGHSLLAARLMHRVKQVFGKTLPLSVLLQAPTIEQLAKVLRNNGWSHRWDSLVAIQPQGSKPPFFCVHGVGGNVVGFHELAQRMKPDYPFYGLQSQGLDGKQPYHTCIEDMAAHYLDEIRTVQASGPYQLGGFSLGGLVAYEMACQLLAHGEEVGLLVLFDTYAGNPKPVNQSLLDLLLQPTRAQLQQLPRALYKKVRRTVRSWRLPEALKNVMRTNARAAEQYCLPPYSGKVTLLRARDTWRVSEDPYGGWGQLVDALATIEIPGTHMDILREPHVSRLAECLKRCIDDADTRQPEGLAADLG